MDIIAKLKHMEPFVSPLPEKRTPEPKANLVKWIPGDEIQNDFGTCFKYLTTYSRDQLNGKNLLNELEKLENKGFALAAKDKNLLDFNPRKTLFVDTETTGLAGGTGTVPFLIGIGYFSDQGFCIDQYMMRDYHEEAALLHALESRFQEAEFIVSYNGKSYDLNILSTRLILNRIDSYLNDLHHFDLLHTVRRIWGARLRDCSLTNIEQKILKFFRDDDIPGYLIPHVYFDYINSGNGQKMIQVFEHNRLDILTLAVLTARTAKIHLDPEQFLKHPRDFFSIAKSLESIGEFRKASLCYKKALQHQLMHSDKEQILYRLGYLFKRSRNWSQANKTWEYIIKHYTHSLTAYEELAKYYEHKTRNYKKASDFVHKALKHIEILQELKGDYLYLNTRAEFEYRLNRLRRKGLHKLGK
ncbi:MAG: ribonuclease H-like domain-containing protein [bacterium]